MAYSIREICPFSWLDYHMKKELSHYTLRQSQNLKKMLLWLIRLPKHDFFWKYRKVKHKSTSRQELCTNLIFSIEISHRLVVIGGEDVHLTIIRLQVCCYTE